MRLKNKLPHLIRESTDGTLATWNLPIAHFVRRTLVSGQYFSVKKNAIFKEIGDYSIDVSNIEKGMLIGINRRGEKGKVLQWDMGDGRKLKFDELDMNKEEDVNVKSEIEDLLNPKNYEKVFYTTDIETGDVNEPTPEDWDQFESLLKSHNWRYRDTNDSDIWKKAKMERSEIDRMKEWLKHYDKERVEKLMKKHQPKDTRRSLHK